MFRTKYRIVESPEGDFIPQYRKWWSLFWDRFENGLGLPASFATFDAAKGAIARLASRPRAKIHPLN